MTYNTKQKELIIGIIKNEIHEFTIKDVYEKLNNKVGLTTIYRLIDKLLLEGQVSKSIGKNNITYYQYLEDCNQDNHFYLKCEECGNMEHVDCDCIGDLSSHIIKKHRFKPSKDHIIINGICRKCNGGIK